jgi:hypothetical protein
MPDPVSGLHRLLDEQASAATEETVRNGGQVSAEQLETLTRLQRLAEIAEGARPAPSREWWILPAVLVASLVFASILLFVHLRNAEVEVDVVSTELAFRLEANTVLAPGMNIAAVSISGPQVVDLPDFLTAEGHLAAVPREVNNISLRVQEKSDSTSITLPSFQLPQGTEVRLEAKAANIYRFTLNTPKGTFAEIPLSCQGQVRVGLSGVPANQYRIPVPAAVHSRAASEQIVLDLTFPDNTRFALTPQLPISFLSFVHVEQNLDRTGVRYISSILSGILYMDSLNGEQHTLRSGEGLRFQTSQGEMRRLSLQEATISSQFQGNVQQMTTGSHYTRVNLMPSLLEWFRARHGVYLLWGTALYLFGIGCGVLRWLRVLQ